MASRAREPAREPSAPHARAPRPQIGERAASSWPRLLNMKGPRNAQGGLEYDVGHSFHLLEDHRRMRLNASRTPIATRRAGCHRTRIAQPCTPADDARRADSEAGRSRPARCPFRNGSHNTLAKIDRQRLGHRLPAFSPIESLNHIPSLWGSMSIPTARKPLQLPASGRSNTISPRRPPSAAATSRAPARAWAGSAR